MSGVADSTKYAVNKKLKYFVDRYNKKVFSYDIYTSNLVRKLRKQFLAFLPVTKQSLTLHFNAMSVMCINTKCINTKKTFFLANICNVFHP